MTMAMKMVRALVLGAAAAVCLGTPAYSAPAPLERAVANTAARTPDNVELDQSRKPAEILSFFRLRSGAQVLDLFGGNGYWTEIMAPAVAPRGRVTVWEPTQFASEELLSKFKAGAGRNSNVQMIVSPFEAPELPAASYDFALINLDYHDVYWQNAQRGIPKMDPDAWLARLYKAMKPGGIVGVVDHAAVAGTDPRVSVEKLHRIDPAVVKADFKRAGFVLDGESDLLRNPGDDHSLLVFDKAIRGKTDRFVFRFRKPAARSR
jgi:predicted methyltransferase